MTGTLMHRHFCPALASFRERNCPKWLSTLLSSKSEGGFTPIERLVLTRGLFPAPTVPDRGAEGFDTFEWVKQAPAIPNGSMLITDGSLLDGRLGHSCQSLGWAFLVTDEHGTLIAMAKGVPPAWVDTIQGAELWAVKMALLYAPFPEVLYTDCKTVYSGVRNGIEWASSSKRRYARLWMSLVDMLEGRYETIHWMPAHTSASSIGWAGSTDGRTIDEIRWSANQIVDMLAKKAAEANRVPAEFGRDLLRCESQLKELLVYLGKLTVQANEFDTGNGVIRDSDPAKPRDRRRKRGSARGREGVGGEGLYLMGEGGCI